MQAAPDSRVKDVFARWQLRIAALLAFGFAGVVAHDVLRSPSVPMLLGDTPWIVAQTPLQTNGMEIDLSHPPLAFFERRFSGDGHAERVTLRVRALREATLFLNREQLPLASDPAQWKEVAVLDVTSRIAPGENVLFVRVRNPDGNPALQLRIDGLAEPLVSDTRWPSAWEGDPVAYATLAEDSIRHPESALLPAPLPSLRAKAIPLACFAAIGAALFLILRRQPRAAAWAPTAALALVTLFWILLFGRALRVPAEVGFDAAAHIEYVEWLLAHRTLAQPGAGAAMYHPPLAFALMALLLGVLRPLGVEGRTILALLPLASGLGMVWVARAMSRALLPGAPWLEAAAIIGTGFLPMNLTIASCVSNEAPYALLTSLALLVTLQALLRERASLRDDLLLGVLLGAAALTKYSSLLWVPLLLGALAIKRWVVERTTLVRAISGGARGLAVVIALAGWVYLRNYELTGDPLVTNRNAIPGRVWWQLPGFHTVVYFTRFGEALVNPWFSGFYSFWDALYTTFWGDGLLSGAVSPRVAVRRWNYTWMAGVFVLALPATLLLGVGWLEIARRSLDGPGWGRRIGFSLLAVLPPILLVTILTVNLHYPYWSLGKAFYALAITPIVGVIGALGFVRLDAALARAPLAIRTLPYAWAAAFVAAIAGSYAA